METAVTLIVVKPSLYSILWSLAFSLWFLSFSLLFKRKNYWPKSGPLHSHGSGYITHPSLHIQNIGIYIFISPITMPLLSWSPFSLPTPFIALFLHWSLSLPLPPASPNWIPFFSLSLSKFVFYRLALHFADKQLKNWSEVHVPRLKGEGKRVERALTSPNTVKCGKAWLLSTNLEQSLFISLQRNWSLPAGEVESWSCQPVTSAIKTQLSCNNFWAS